MRPMTSSLRELRDIYVGEVHGSKGVWGWPLRAGATLKRSHSELFFFFSFFCSIFLTLGGQHRIDAGVPGCGDVLIARS